MAKTARRPEEVEKIKEAILECAADILSNEGFEMLTMRRIAFAMDMSATNLYNYFASKDEIYISVLISGFERLCDIFSKIDGSSLPPMKKARRLMEAYMQFGLDNRNYYDIMFTRPAPKYNDYVGTPLERLAAVEMNHSAKIIEISSQAISAVMSVNGRKISAGGLNLNLLKVWALLHGLIVLHNSKISEYVSPGPLKMYGRIIRDIINSFVQQPEKKC